MFINFEEMPGTARIWIYQSELPLPSEINAFAQQFVAGWNAHGQPLQASFQVFYGHFFGACCQRAI